MFRTAILCTAACALAACATTPLYEIETAEIPASAETDPMPGTGDRADDPAIWFNSADPEQSLILGTDKENGLYVYDLTGKTKAFLKTGRINNVDLRGRIAVASNDELETITWFEIFGDDLPTVNVIADTPVNYEEPYGICLGQDETYLAAVTYKDGTVQIWSGEVGKDSHVDVSLYRTDKLSSQLEGCVFDEDQGLLFIGEEEVGIWSLAYRDPGAKPKIVDLIANENGLVADVEGISLWHSEDGGYLVASAQAADRYVVYDRLAPHAPRGVFKITDSVDGSVDGVSHTDGLDVSSAPLHGYPNGLMVVQDDANPVSEQGQNFKLVDWTLISEALELE